MMTSAVIMILLPDPGVGAVDMAAPFFALRRAQAASSEPNSEAANDSCGSAAYPPREPKNECLLREPERGELFRGGRTGRVRLELHHGRLAFKAVGQV